MNCDSEWLEWTPTCATDLARDETFLTERSEEYSTVGPEGPPAEDMEANPTVEVEIHSHSQGFMQMVTASAPFQMMVATKRRCQGRKARIGLAFVGVVLVIVGITIPVTKDKDSKGESTSNPKGKGRDKRDVVVGDNGIDLQGDIESRTEVSFRPFSTWNPADFFPVTDRPETSRPSSRLMALKANSKALPTNAWYQNILLLRDGETPTADHRAYTQPYVVDVAGPIPGLRMQMGRIDTTSDQVIVADGSPDALTLGAAPPSTLSGGDADLGYSVVAANDLGLTLEWTYFGMRSPIVRGMPYATMIYPSRTAAETVIFPTIHVPRRLSDSIVVDQGSSPMTCGASFTVDSELELTLESGVKYMIFLSSPQMVLCLETSDGGTMLQVLHGAQTEELIVRAALVITSQDEALYSDMLRTYSNVFPGQNTSVGYEFGTDQAALLFDWDAQKSRDDHQENEELIMFAMPHHQDRMGTITSHCASVLLGSVCLIIGKQWAIVEKLPPISFRAPRGPDASMLPAMIQAVTDDLNFRVADNYMRGAGDTYFSGKALAKLARILLITEEVVEICEQPRLRRGLQSAQECGEVALPDSAAVAEALTHLKAGVEIWLSAAAQATLVYDKAWGGIVSCGCSYSGGNCENAFPNCPGLSDQGLNFGAGFYNDHHFHYGYHIYAAAVVAHFDPEWGRKNFERVLLLIRDIANPSLDDPFFPPSRHKDWFHGSSWASGISLPVSPTGMNQESSSEAIAGYEAVALFGKVMEAAFTDEGSKGVASDIYQFGRLLAATELRSTKRYWQVSRSQSIVQEPYQHNVVGILWSSKLYFGTWFGNNPYFIYGIQLLPLTPISEERDNLDWAREAFDPYASTCDSRCVAEGWSVQILALLASLGQKEKAMGHAKNLTASIFEVAGGSGHSLSNTLWYIASRPATEVPFTLDRTYPWEAGPFTVTCLQAEMCTADVLDSMAGEASCRSRITFLMNTQSMSEVDACYQVAVTEYPEICGACTPVLNAFTEEVIDTISAPEAIAEDLAEEDVVSGEEATMSPTTLTCSQPTTCTSEVLASNAGGFPCGERIQYIMDRGISEAEACRIVASYEYPAVCGGCNPDY